jgi:predicted nuclease of predicted toxin-antitoxin system
MKFLIDAQLPRLLCDWLKDQGHDVLHTLDLPKGNRTPDHEITTIASDQARVVITKDSDFVQSFFVNGNPTLLLLSTGNISNLQLLAVFKQNLPKIVSAFDGHRFVEIAQGDLIVHE